jgi:hypothetical protein
VPFRAKDIKVGFSNINAKAEGIDWKRAFQLAIMPCTMAVNDVWTPPVPGAGMGYSSSGFHSGCSAWYSNEPGAGSALGRPASAAASRALITASALRRVVSADPQVSGTRRFTSRAAFTMQAGRGHRERIAKVKEVYDEMMRIAEAIHDRGGGR